MLCVKSFSVKTGCRKDLLHPWEATVKDEEKVTIILLCNRRTGREQYVGEA
jgi:hypothetical protein